MEINCRKLQWWGCSMCLSIWSRRHEPFLCFKDAFPHWLPQTRLFVCCVHLWQTELMGIIPKEETSLWWQAHSTEVSKGAHWGALTIVSVRVRFICFPKSSGEWIGREVRSLYHKLLRHLCILAAFVQFDPIQIHRIQSCAIFASTVEPCWWLASLRAPQTYI